MTREAGFSFVSECNISQFYIGFQSYVEDRVFFSFNIGRAWVRSAVRRQLSLCFRKLIRTASEVRFWWHRWEIPVSVGWKIELARWWPRSWSKVTPWYPDRTEDGGKSENGKKHEIIDVIIKSNFNEKLTHNELVRKCTANILFDAQKFSCEFFNICCYSIFGSVRIPRCHF